MRLHPAPALAQRLRMSEQLFNLRAADSAQETMLNRQHNLRHDFQVAIDEHVQRVGHDAFR